jgi:hypothetical protein
MRYTLQAIRPLDLYAKNRVFLLGDAVNKHIISQFIQAHLLLRHME